jgi:AhpD family alkylhydroperoxidase
MRALAALDAEVTEQASAAGLDPRLVDLVKIRTSQINGCAYCLRLHTREALEHGEPAERLAVLPAWRETEYFSAQERAALALAEAVTLVSEGQVPDEVYEQAALHLSDAQIAAVSWVAVVINSFNRVAITSRYPVAPGAA